jgi:hypothetical protein
MFENVEKRVANYFLMQDISGKKAGLTPDQIEKVVDKVMEKIKNKDTEDTGDTDTEDIKDTDTEEKDTEDTEDTEDKDTGDKEEKDTGDTEDKDDEDAYEKIVLSTKGLQTRRKDKDLITDTGGDSHKRRETTDRPPREDVRKPFRVKDKKPEDEDPDVDNDPDLKKTG